MFHFSSFPEAANVKLDKPHWNWLLEGDVRIMPGTHREGDAIPVPSTWSSLTYWWATNWAVVLVSTETHALVMLPHPGFECLEMHIPALEQSEIESRWRGAARLSDESSGVSFTFLWPSTLLCVCASSLFSTSEQTPNLRIQVSRYVSCVEWSGWKAGGGGL